MTIHHISNTDFWDSGKPITSSKIRCFATSLTEKIGQLSIEVLDREMGIPEKKLCGQIIAYAAFARRCDFVISGYGAEGIAIVKSDLTPELKKRFLTCLKTVAENTGKIEAFAKKLQRTDDEYVTTKDGNSFSDENPLLSLKKERFFNQPYIAEKSKVLGLIDG